MGTGLLPESDDPPQLESATQTSAPIKFPGLNLNGSCIKNAIGKNAKEKIVEPN
jgi:hypothetical protein